ncbi:acetyltransferase, GNAT family [Streptococcus downei F0415]|uniref:Acetyltransferase, gnat family n=1 Tax=Streptococcus downei MFe28 TaxID=764290 RepID=A0A380JC91_STRDO|nr:acetyltransferase, GNAT family [Streptococcus downei F0415]SUN35274.1 acetyltransferase, gnat family [Streptococcus downei MFe28]
MELRRPQLADKTAVLDLMAEFQAEESPHAGGFWDSQNFDYQAWLERNKETELGLSLPDK